MTNPSNATPRNDGLREQLQRALGDAYVLQRELGGGGMSRVFLAEETELGRQVVVKVLSSDAAGELSAERFAREIRLAATLQQANIVPLLKAGISNGIPFYTMPFVEGESLRTRMDEQEEMPYEQAVGVLRDIARALAYAHTRGVVHRDIKPENVLLSGGTAVVTDFGIAKAVTAATEHVADAAATLTRLGMQVGTPAYMAPEQAAGDPRVDHRADLYSFGVLAYELLAGRHPFSGRRGAHEYIMAHLTQLPDALPIHATAPEALAALVLGCLAKDPGDRPQSASVVIATLEDAHTSGERAVVRPKTPHTGEPAVAVLPFVNLSGDVENDFLSDGITDEIIGTLGRLRVVRLAGRASCFALKGKNLEPQEVGRRLNVTSLVEGSVRRSGNHVRVSAELVNAVDGFQLWSDRYDRDIADIFALQDEIGQAIGTALSSHMAAPAPSVSGTANTTVNADAYRLYLQCIHVLRNQFTPDSYAHALALVDRAIELDPTFGRAHEARADVFNNMYLYCIRLPSDVCPLAKDAAQKALSLAPALASAWSILGQIAYAYDWDWAGARAAFERGAACDPDDSAVLARSALFHAADGHELESMACAQRLVQTDPLSAWTRFVACHALRMLRRYDEVLVMAREALELNPHHAQALNVLGNTYLHLGQPEKAITVYESSAALAGRSYMVALGLSAAHAMRGHSDKAAEIIDEMIVRHRAVRSGASWIAYACGALGRYDDAFAWLEEALDAREYQVGWLGADPNADPLRGDPRFDVILRRIGRPALQGLTS